MNGCRYTRHATRGRRKLIDHIFAPGTKQNKARLFSLLLYPLSHICWPCLLFSLSAFISESNFLLILWKIPLTFSMWGANLWLGPEPLKKGRNDRKFDMMSGDGPGRGGSTINKQRKEESKGKIRFVSTPQTQRQASIGSIRKKRKSKIRNGIDSKNLGPWLRGPWTVVETPESNKSRKLPRKPKPVPNQKPEPSKPE